MIAPAERDAQREAGASGNLLAAARRAREARRRREQIFGDGLLAEPCWDLLLDLFIAAREGRKVSINAACMALPVPRGTAQRCIAHLIDVGLIIREIEPAEHGVPYLVPTGRTVDKMTIFLSRPDQGAEMTAA